MKQRTHQAKVDPKYQQIYPIVLKRRQKICRNNKSKETRYQRNNINTTENKKQWVSKQNRSYHREKNNNLTRNSSSVSDDYIKPKNIAIFLANILKTLQMKKFNDLLNGGVTHLTLFTGSKAKQLSHHIIPILEEIEYDTAILHVSINNLLRFDKNSSTLVSVQDDIIRACLRCRNFNIGKVFV